MWLKSCMGTLYLSDFVGPHTLWVLLPAKLIPTSCFHNEHHSNHFYLRISMDIKNKLTTSLFILCMNDVDWNPQSLKLLSLGVHYGKCSLKWLKSLYGCLVSMVMWLYCDNETNKIYTLWSFCWYIIHMLHY